MKEIALLHGGIRCTVVVLSRTRMPFAVAKEWPRKARLARRVIARFMRNCLRWKIFSFQEQQKAMGGAPARGIGSSS